MKLYLAKFEARNVQQLNESATVLLPTSWAHNILREAWTKKFVVEGGGDDDLTLAPNSPNSPCPWCVAAIRQTFYVPFYGDIKNDPPTPADFNGLFKEIVKISKASFSTKIKRAQTAFEQVQARAQGVAGEITTDRTTKTETREYEDKIKALGGLAEPTRDAFMETRTGGGETSHVSGVMEATPAELFENAAAGAGIRSPYEKAADMVLRFTIPADFRERAGYYASIGADWWAYMYPEIFEAVEI
jgi:hypothetical protein